MSNETTRKLRELDRVRAKVIETKGRGWVIEIVDDERVKVEWQDSEEVTTEFADELERLPMPASDALEAQGRLEPGTVGWWRLWGSSVQDIRDGDLLMIKGSNDKHPREYEVKQAYPQDGGIADMCAPRFLVTDGTGEPEVRRLGVGMAVVILRRGTHNTLSDTVR